MKKGTKCTICTGCGRCFGEYRDSINILSAGDANDLTGVSGYPEKPYAFAFSGASGNIQSPECGYIFCADIGTTTIAMALLDRELKAVDSYKNVNPQGKYGADVISRIKASKDRSVLSDMQSMVIDELKTGCKKFLNTLKKISHDDSFKDKGSESNADAPIPELYIAGNTTMKYLLMGYDPSELGEAPFKVSHSGGEYFDLSVYDTSVRAFVLPEFSAFVGADIYAGILSSGVCDSDGYTLLCDLGTNGEIALGNRDNLYVTATAAGPAFEGGPLKGIWGADIIHIASELLKEGIIDSTGLLSEPFFENGIMAGNVHITQEQVRALQLAKAAMNAGIKIITEKAGISFSDIKKCILAGGFGYFLSPNSAVSIKLIPEALLSVCHPGGNTALSGCALYAMGKRVNKKTEVINLAMTPGFNELYMDSINF